MRQNQKFLRSQTFDYRIGDLIHRHRTLDQKIIRVLHQHVRSHPLRAKRRNFDARIAIGHRKPFREPERGVLRHRVNHRFKRRQQSRGGDRLQQVSFAAREHSRQHRASRVDVRQQMNIAHFEPIRIRCVDASGNEDADIRAEKIDLAVTLTRFGDQPLNLLFASNIDAHTHAARIDCPSFSAFDIEIGGDHRSRAFFMESFDQRFADSTRCSGYYDNFVANVHDSSFNVDYGPAANLACENLLAQLEYFTQRLDLNHGIEQVHRQIAHDARPNLYALRVRYARGIDAQHVHSAQNKWKHRR